MSEKAISRRILLGTGMASLGALSVGAPLSQGTRRRQAKNIIVLVSDGMSAGVVSMLDRYLAMTTGRPSFWRRLMNRRDVTNGSQDTRSLNSLVTDSAAASSAWGSGQFHWNGQINVLPDGREATPLLRLLKERAKMATGLVATSTITHATPAGFAVCSAQRDDEEGIAEKYLQLGVDVLLGGGDRFFSAQSRRDKKDLYAEYRKAGYAVARSAAELRRATGSKLLGVFSPGHIPYRIDRLHDPKLAQLPGLKEMSKKALDTLKGSREGFILQIEAARVDHAAHGNDFAGILHDQLEFDEVTEMVMDWAENEGETLVVVTSDHGNANPGLLGAGDDYGNSTSGLLTLQKMTASYEALTPLLRERRSADAVKEVVKEKLGIALADHEANLAASAFTSNTLLGRIEQYDLFSSCLSLALSNHTHVCWAGRQHTNDFTMVSAFGPGRERFAGVTQNTDWFNLLLAHRGIRHRNPSMSFEDASKAMAARKQAGSYPRDPVHWL